MKKMNSLIDLLNNEESRRLVESIEEAEEEIRGREIDEDDESEFFVRSRNMDIKELKERFGYSWR